MQLYGKFKVSLPDESWVWQPDDMTGTECRVIEDRLGVTFDVWLQQIVEARFAACQALVWFLRNKAGHAELLDQVDFPIRRLDVVQIDERDRPIRAVVRTVKDAAGVDVAVQTPQTFVDGAWVDTSTLPEDADPEAPAGGSAPAADISPRSPDSATDQPTSTF